MRKLIVLDLVGLAIVIGLAVMLAQNARVARNTLEDIQEFTAAEVEAAEIRTQMIAMSDAMRGYLLDTSNKAEADKKEAANAALVKAVERLLEATSNAEFESLATQIGELDETKLDRIEDAIVEMAAKDAAAATESYWKDYVPVRTEQMALVDKLQSLAKKAYADEMTTVESQMTRTLTLVIWVGGAVILLMMGASAWSALTATRVTRQLTVETETLTGTAQGVFRAAQEVSRASQSLSQGATEQAASLEETSASMEEMASMTRQNAENSQPAAALMSRRRCQVHGSNRRSPRWSRRWRRSRSRASRSPRSSRRSTRSRSRPTSSRSTPRSKRRGPAKRAWASRSSPMKCATWRSVRRRPRGHRGADRRVDRQGRATAARRSSRWPQPIAAITDSVTKVKGLVEEVSDASRQQAQGIDRWRRRSRRWRR